MQLLTWHMMHHMKLFKEPWKTQLLKSGTNCKNGSLQSLLLMAMKEIHFLTLMLQSLMTMFFIRGKFINLQLFLWLNTAIFNSFSVTMTRHWHGLIGLTCHSYKPILQSNKDSSLSHCQIMSQFSQQFISRNGLNNAKTQIL